MRNPAGIFGGCCGCVCVEYVESSGNIRRMLWVCEESSRSMNMTMNIDGRAGWARKSIMT